MFLRSMNKAAQTQDLGKMRDAAEISMQILAKMRDAVAPGVTTADLDVIAERECERLGAVAAFKGVVQTKTAGPYPANACISVNDEVLHTIPSATKVISEGDIVKLDFGINYQGYYTDHCVTVGVGKITSEDERLIRTGKLAVESAVKICKPGRLTGELGYTMQSVAELAGFNVVKEFVGHGIGQKLHQDPNIFTYGEPDEGDVLEQGMVLCVEAQIVAGDDDIYILEDGWTVKTADGSNSVMFEYMVIVGEEPEIITDTRSWGILV